MIDLSKAKTGDKYLCNHNFDLGITMKVFYVNIKADMVILKNDTHGDMIVDLKGKGFKSGNSAVVSKVEDRLWLKDMPDMSNVRPDIKWFACDKLRGWWAYTSKPKMGRVGWDSEDEQYALDCFGIKSLEDDEWKNSLISKEELESCQNEFSCENPILIDADNVLLPKEGDYIMFKTVGDTNRFNNLTPYKGYLVVDNDRKQDSKNIKIMSDNGYPRHPTLLGDDIEVYWYIEEQL